MSLLCHAGLKRNSARILMLPHDAYDVKLELLRYYQVFGAVKLS
jgi:hypothetical protein